MTNQNLECFRDSAIKFLQEEINKNVRAKDSIAGLQFSASAIANDAVSGLLTKGPVGFTKSISQHVTEFAKQTTGFADQLINNVGGDLKNIFTRIKSAGDLISNSPDSAMYGILSTMTSNPALIYSLVKNAFNRSSRLANQRITLSSNIINKINNIRSVRVQIIPGDAPTTDPESAADEALDLINSSIIFLKRAINSSGRLPTIYTIALEKMSQALDKLKIGSGQFLLQEYLQLKKEYEELISDFSNIDLDIKDSNNIAKNAEEDYESTKDGVRTIESKYIKEVMSRMIQLSRDIKAVLDKNNDKLTLSKYEIWASQLLSIYSLAHVAYDKDIQSNVSNASNPDKIAYQSAKTSLESIENDLDADPIIVKLNDLNELYFSFLFGLVPENSIHSLEEDIKKDLVLLSQSDQQLVSIDTGFNPPILEILTILSTTTKDSGLNLISDAITKGSVGGLFGLLEESLGSSAAKAAGCLSQYLLDVDNEETRNVLLRANSRMQGIQRKRQLAGAIRQGNFDRASRSIDESIRNTQQLTEQLKGLSL